MATSSDKRTKSKAKKSSRRSNGAGSFLLSRTSRLSARCTWSFRRGIVSKVFCTADRVDQDFRNGAASYISEKTGFRDAVLKPVKKAVAVGASRSVFFARGDGLRHAFLHTKARFFGIALLVFAMYSAGIFLAKEYIGLGLGESSPMDLCTAAGSLLLALLLLFCGKPMNTFLGGSRLFSRLFIGVLGMDEGAFRGDEEKTSAHGGIAFVVGTLAGVLTLLLRPHLVLLLVLGVAFCLCIPAVPEMGLLTAVVLLPVVPLRYTAFFVVLAFLGYLFKLIRLKRVLHFCAPELFMALTVGVCGLSAWNTGDVFFLKRMLLFGCIWFLTVNLITTERLLQKYISAIVYGGLLTLAITAGGTLLSIVSLPGIFSGISLPVIMGGSALKTYLMMMTPFALMLGKRRSGLVLLLLILANTYFIGSLWLAVGIFLAVLLYAVFARGAWVGTMLIGGAAFSVATVYVGDKLGSLATGFSTAARELALRYVWTGIGSGNGALATAAMAEGLYLDGNTVGFYTRLILEGGILLLFLFVFCVFLAGQRLFTTLRDIMSGQEKGRTILCGTVVASAVMFLLGVAVSDIWLDLRILGVFFCICPVASLAGTLFGYEQAKEEEWQWI